MSCLPIFHRYLEEHEQQVDDSLQAVCIILDTASDGLSFAPISGLDTAASALSSLITMVIKARENVKAKGEIADSAGELAKCIKDTMQDALKPSPQLLRRVEELGKKLEELVHQAEKLSAGSFLLRCLRSEQNAAILDGIKEGINVARGNFMLQGVVMMEIQGNKIAENVEGIGQVVMEIKANQQVNKNEEILRSLPRADEAEYRSAVNELKNGYLPGTRVSLLDQLEGWATGSDPALQAYPIYVLCGAAGTGKSTIAYEISKRLEQRGLLGASFFFVRGSEGLSSTRLVFPTIAYQLARLHQDFYAVIVDASNNHMQHGTKQQMDYELDDLIIKPLKKVAADHSPVVIVIDAVDECTELATVRVSRMLHLLMKRVPEVPFPLRVLITTRPEMHIEDAFMTFEDKQLFIMEEIPRPSVDEDIKLYISNSLRSIRYSKQLLDMRPDFVDHLTARSEGLFIYATTAVGMLRDDPEHLTSVADQLLSDRTVATLTSLDSLYLSVLTNAFTSTALDRSDNRKCIQQILGSVALLQDHLSPKVLSELMNISVEETRYTLARLGSVIYFDSENPEEQIRPLHASFPQFLVDAERCTDPHFFINPVIQHEQLAIACLELLNTERVLRRNIPPHVQYACTHWATHVAAAAQSSRLRSLLDSFCSTKLLLYLEALSAMNRLETAVPSLLKVKAWYQTFDESHESLTLNLLDDCYRIVLEYYVPIDNCPEHLYISALPMVPSCSLLQAYSGSPNAIPPIRMLTDRDGAWSACLRVVEGHTQRVTSAKFSPNGRWIASSCWDRTVRTWDAESGTPMAIMRSHNDSVEDVDFSPDNQRIVSGSSDGTLRIWNAASGAPLNKLPARHGNVFAVAYSPDGSTIVSGSFDNALHLWDARDGKELELVDAAIDCVNSVAFSPDGSMVASASSDSIVRIWDVRGRYLIKILRGHTDMAKSVAFFPDNARVVSGASDNTVRIWFLETETCLKVLKGHLHRVFAVAVSPNGDRIASGAEDNTIRIWDSQLGDCLGVLKDHTSWVLSVSFSMRGDRLVSASDDQTVRIWDPTLLGANPVGHTSAVTCIVFSHDGARVASCSEDATIMIWDASSGQRSLTLEGHTSRLQTIAFAPDGTKLISGGWDNLLNSWDTATGALVNSVKAQETGIEELAYSPDGRLIASGANNLDPIIKLWTASDCAVEREITVDFKGEPIDMISRLEFSPDSTKLYASTLNGLEYIWDCATGTNLKFAENNWGAGTDRRRFVEKDDGWLVLRETGQTVCWLPGSKRGNDVGGDIVCACYGDKYAVGGGSGRVTILDLTDRVESMC